MRWLSQQKSSAAGRIVRWGSANAPCRDAIISWVIQAASLREPRTLRGVLSALLKILLMVVLQSMRLRQDKALHSVSSS